VSRRHWERVLGVLVAAALIVSATAPATAAGRQGKLTASDAAAGDRFGLSVAVSGRTLVVGAPQSDGVGDNSGSA
jgi:hypothetical protein